MVNFILALIVAILSLSGGSLLWPRLTSQPRPQFLQQVHDIVLQTPAGQQAAAVLGVSEEAAVEPVNGNDIVSGAVGALREAVQDRAQSIIVTQLTRDLSEEKKKELQEIICTPVVQ